MVSMKTKYLLSFFILVLTFIIFFYYSDQKLIPSSKLIYYKTFNISGKSMEPYLKDGEEVYVLLNYYDYSPMQRGDYVAFYFKSKNNLYVKYVVAVPDDYFTIDNRGKILVNNQYDPYFANFSFQPEQFKRIFTLLALYNTSTLPKDSYVVLSLNPKHDFDSRKFGFLYKRHVVGKVVQKQDFDKIKLTLQEQGFDVVNVASFQDNTVNKDLFSELITFFNKVLNR